MAFILYQNLIRTGTLSSIGTVSGSLGGAIDGRTSTTEGFATGATREFKIDCGTARDVNCLCFARHNFSTVGATVTVQGSTDDIGYSTLFAITPSKNTVQFKLESSTHNYRYYKIQISGHTNTATVADIALGKVMSLDRDQKFGFISPFFADGDTVVPNKTRGQNLVGLSIKEAVKRVKFQMPYYTASFFNEWETFVDVLKKYPIYIVWKAADDSECFYGWPARNMPTPKFSANISGYAYYDFTLELEGITS